MLGHPPGDALPDAQLQAIDDVRMRRLRRAQHEVVFLEHVDEARVALARCSRRNRRRGRARHAADRPPRCGCRSRAAHRCRSCPSRRRGMQCFSCWTLNRLRFEASHGASTCAHDHVDVTVSHHGTQSTHACHCCIRLHDTNTDRPLTGAAAGPADADVNRRRRERGQLMPRGPSSTHDDAHRAVRCASSRYAARRRPRPPHASGTSSRTAPCPWRTLHAAR